jgi:hypothetical protein
MFEELEAGPGSNRRIKVLEISEGHLSWFASVPPCKYFQLVTGQVHHEID